jgi:hypothetical protein
MEPEVLSYTSQEFGCGPYPTPGYSYRHFNSIQISHQLDETISPVDIYAQLNMFRASNSTATTTL